MTLRNKTLMILGTALGGLLAVLYLVTSSILDSSFMQLEQQTTVRNAQRARDALLNEVDSLRMKACDWACWDDSYEFVQTGGEEFIESNLGTESLVALQINLIVYVDLNAKIVFAKCIDLATETDMPMPASLLAEIRPGSVLLTHPTLESSVGGLLGNSTDHPPLMLISMPILTSVREGPPRGTLIFGRVLDEGQVQHLSNITHQPVRFSEPALQPGNADLQQLAQSLAANEEPIFRIHNDHLACGYFLVRDIYAKPLLVGQVDSPRAIFGHGRTAQRLFLISLLVVGLCVGIGARVVLDRLVLAPLSALRNAVRHITATGDLAHAAPAASSDEIGDLGRDVNRMVAHLQQAQLDLTRARDAAEAATGSKSLFLANMSHEIRTPMTAILGYADLLLDLHQSPSDRIDAVQAIRRNGDHLLRIINDILDISKIESGKLDVERIECSPVEVIADVVSIMRGRALQKGLSFDVKFDGLIPKTIKSDPTRLRQILLNLAGNAVKFTERGGVSLTIRMTRSAADVAEALSGASLPAPQGGVPQRHLLFEVSDTGIGLTPEQQQRLFQPFVQADTSHTRRFGGTGLGLIISRRLAQMLGGDIELRSQQSEGTTFTAYIDPGDLAGVEMLDSPTEIEAPAITPQQAAAASMPADLLKGARILIAEDGLDNQRLIKHHLVKVGATVAIANHGGEALTMVQTAEQANAPYHLILMDMQMPELDGYGATMKLRARGYTRPIVALTAHAMPGDREKCLQAGCDDFLSKPIDRVKLVHTCAERIRQFAANEQTVA